MNYSNQEYVKATEAELEELRGHLREYVESITEPSPKAGRDFYVCPFDDCNSGTGPKATGAFALYDCGAKWKCFACDRGGDLFDLMAGLENLDVKRDFPAIVTEAREMFGRGVNVAYTPQRTAHTAMRPQREEPEQDYGDYLTKCRANIDGGMAYLAGRGFTAATVERFGLGFDTGKQAITIPVNNSRHAFSMRFIGENPQHRYMSHGKLPVFNVASLYRESPCFVVEGQFDAMSIEQMGGRAVAITGSNTNALYRQIGERKPGAPLIVAMDGDDPGRKKSEEMCKRLDDMKIPYIVADWTVGGKDANERLGKDPKGFGRDVQTNIARALESTPAKLDNVADYLTQAFKADIARGMGDTIPTGFAQLDKKLNGGLHAGLYVLGAVPSLGKTSLAWQIADNIAASGRTVLFYSLEMSRFEMVSKAISRYAAGLYSVDLAPSALDVRMGKNPEIVGKAVEAFAATSAKRLNIIPGGLDMTVGDICDHAAARVDSQPVVFVDYLQIMRSGDPRTDSDDKRRTDEAMRQLKQLSASHGLTVFVVSSLNRQNYEESASFQSFKESGGVEYTADTILGLQLRAITEPEYMTAKSDTTKKREIIEAAKMATPRRLRLLCLKNRSGLTGWNLDMDYYPRCDTFRESEDFPAFTTKCF